MGAIHKRRMVSSSQSLKNNHRGLKPGIGRGGGVGGASTKGWHMQTGGESESLHNHSIDVGDGASHNFNGSQEDPNISHSGLEHR